MNEDAPGTISLQRLWEPPLKLGWARFHFPGNPPNVWFQTPLGRTNPHLHYGDPYVGDKVLYNGEVFVVV